jgi:hypothetical protein
MNAVVADVEERVLSLFQPDTLLGFEYHEGLRRKIPLEPEKCLMLALLEDAVTCFKKNLFARSAPAKELFHEAEDWILEEQSTDLFSFNNVCESFGLEPVSMRQELLRWKERQLSERQKTTMSPLAAA